MPFYSKMDLQFFPPLFNLEPYVCVWSVWSMHCTALTSVYSVMGVQLVLQTEFLGAVFALVRFVHPVLLLMGLWLMLDRISSTEHTPCTYHFEL